MLGNNGNRGETILFVEDDALFAKTQAKALFAQGYSVIWSASGEESVAEIRADPDLFDLVLMDINLGTGMDGAEAAREILTVRNVPIIFLSSLTEKEILEKTESINAYGYVTKDADISVLSVSIRTALKLFHAHRKIAESEERFRLLFETMSQGVVFQDADGKLEMANQAAERILGLSIEQKREGEVSAPQWNTIHEDGSELPESDHPALVALRTGRPVFGTNMGVYDQKRQRYRWVRVDAIPLSREGEKNPYRVYTMFTDIGERDKIEEAQSFLAKRGWDAAGEDFFQALARFLRLTLEADYVCIDRLEGNGLNARTVAVFPGGGFENAGTYALKDTPCGDVDRKTICCIPRSVRILFPKDALLQEMDAESYVGTILWGGDGKPIGLIAVISHKPLENPQLAETVLSLVAIRAAGELERRESAETLRRLVNQKETLLRELQHRVKNNLNVVTSLLDLETDKLPDERTRDVFLGARTRIQSISTIYEKLYLSDDFQAVDLGSYIRDIAVSIFEAYEIAKGLVRLSVKADTIKIDTKRAVPLGLILNELISNALKHAYPAGSGGDLRIASILSGTRIELSVSDDGVGLPPGFDPEKAETMGMDLVRMLADELQADLVFKNEKGLTVSISFEL